MEMRSDLIHEALRTVSNRYTLCQLASKATRKFHKPNTRIQDTMNEILEKFGEASGEPSRVVASQQKVAEGHRRAA
jgi:regulator of protease activity HflC (stomatin/prohibitin superfamily)